MTFAAPLAFSRSEKFFGDVEAHAKGTTCHAIAWSCTADPSLGALRTPISWSVASRRPIRYADCCFDMIVQGIAGFAAGDWCLAICKWNNALAMLGAIVQSQHHRALEKVMDCILELSSSGHDRVANVLRNRLGTWLVPFCL